MGLGGRGRRNLVCFFPYIFPKNTLQLDFISLFLSFKNVIQLTLTVLYTISFLKISNLQNNYIHRQVMIFFLCLKNMFRTKHTRFDQQKFLTFTSSVMK